MNGLQGLALVLGVDDDGNVAFGGALADGPDAHAVAPEGAEGAPGNAALLAHAVTDQRHNGKARFDDERLNAADLLLCTKLLVQRGFSISGVSVGHGDADGVFARPLRNEDHVDAGQREGREKPAGKAGDADHATTADGDEGDVLEGAQSGNAAVGQRGVLALGGRDDERARAFRVVRQSDVHGNVLFGELGDGRREDHLGAEMAQFHGLGIAELIDHASRRDHAGVGGHHAGDIGPLLQGGGAEEAGGIGCTEVTASPTERGGRALGCRADEALHEEEVALVESGLAEMVTRGLHIQAGRAEPVIGAHQLEGVEPLRGEPEIREVSPENRHGEPLTEPHQFVEGAGAGFAKEVNAVEQVVQMAEPLFELRLDGIIGGALQQVECALDVAVVDVTGHVAVAAIAGLGQAPCVSKGIGDAAQGGTDHHGAVAVLLALVRENTSAGADAVRIGNGGASEFQDLHGRSRLVTTLRIVHREVAVFRIKITAQTPFRPRLSQILK